MFHLNTWKDNLQRDLQLENWLGMKLSNQLKHKWESWKQSLPTSVSVPRSIPEFKVYVQIIDFYVFGDASQNDVYDTVYSAVPSIKWYKSGFALLKATTAQARLTIPRLELVPVTCPLIC